MPQLVITRLTGDQHIQSAYPLMKQLRPHLQESTFLQTVRQQESGGYILIAGYAAGELVCLAGYRHCATLSRGPHLFVDDLVTNTELQGKGFGRQVLKHLAKLAEDASLPRIYLDSRDTAAGFYRQIGFTFLSSIPCWIETAALLQR